MPTASGNVVFITETTPHINGNSYGVSQTPVASTLDVFIDGVHQIPSGSSLSYDYFFDQNNMAINFTTSPYATSSIIAKYMVTGSVSGYVSNENIGTGNGSLSQFYTAQGPVVNSNIDLYVNGIHQVLSTDFSLNALQSGISFSIPPYSGSSIYASYYIS